MRSRKTSYFKTTSLPSIYFQSNMIFRDYRTIKTVFFFIFLDSYDCFAMIKRNVTLVNMVQKWNNGMSYSTCFCDIFWGDFIWSITEKCLAFKDCGSASIFSSLWLPFPTNLTFAFFFFHFFFPEPWTEKNVYSIWLSPRNEEKGPIYSLKEEETF